MDDSEGGLSFDFEGGLDAGVANPAGSLPSIHPESSAPAAPAGGAAVAGGGTASDPATGQYNGRRSFRQTVCRHWLRSLCMKGDACGFLHQYDKARMPICRFFRLFGECREQDCVYKHSNEDIKECNMYKLGFCPNGPDCRYRHAKLPGPPPPVEEVLQKINQFGSFNHNNNGRFFHNRNSGYGHHSEKSQVPSSQAANQNIASKQSATESPNSQMLKAQQPQHANQSLLQSIPSGQANQPNRTVLPLPRGDSRYFIVKSCNRENFELSIQQGAWATQRSNEAKLNEAFDSAEDVILIFSINRTRHFQGCAKMTSKIGGFVGGGNWKYAHGTPHYGRNFSVKWLKLCELSFQKTRHLRNPYNENLPVKISRDCQELEPSVGEQLASLLYLEPDSELMAISVAAESKREEEKAGGANSDTGGEKPDIVPFEDNEEEDEEESEEDEEGFGQVPGRGRGMMWPPPPHMPLARGIRPIPGMRGFPPDGFSYGPDGFVMPDLFGAGPRGFPPYGPRFAGDFTAPASGMMFQGRPQFAGSGFGMMMGGGGRPPFMAAAPPRASRPGLPPVFPPSLQGNPRNGRRDQNDRHSGGLEPNKGLEQGDHQAGPGNELRNEESESEDEAPRRSRHG